VSIKTPRLIRDRCGVYYFRFVVPATLRQTVGKTELRRSLRTKDAALARQKALALSLAVEAITVDPKFLSNPTLGDFAHLLGSDADIRKKIKIDVDRGTMEVDTLEEAKMASSLLTSMVEARKQLAEVKVAKITEFLPKSKTGFTLKQAKDDYLGERRAILKGTTWRKQRGVIEAFIASQDDRDLGMVEPTHVSAYKKEMLAAKREGTTINDHISILNGFFDYCIDNKLVNMVNPAAGLFIKGANKKIVSYQPFNVDELGRIFNPVVYRKKMVMPDCYWGPLIALFTGARAEEIASLGKDDVYQLHGHWVFHIRRGKTKNAQRIVPVHDKLIDLGWIRYIEWLKSTDYKMVFPHLVDGANGYKKNLSRAFGILLDQPEIDIVDELKVFHSFRHTVITKLTAAGLNEGLKRALVGHDSDSPDDAHGTYIHLDHVGVKERRDAIQKLEYEGLVLDGLTIEGDAFEDLIDQRLTQRERRSKKAVARSKAKQQEKAVAKKASNKSHMGP
jgi:integrase